MKKLILLIMTIAACGGDKAAPSPAAAPDDLADLGAEIATVDVPDAPDPAEVADVTPPVSPLRAGKVESTSDLIGGEGAYGQVGGAWFIENELARFLIQDVGVAIGLDLYGGNLIDADLVRPDGEAGNDRFRELFPSVGFLVVAPETIAVADDGASGEQVVLRLEGTLKKSRILDLLDDVADDVDLGVRQDYVLESGSRTLAMVTTLTNPGPGDVAVTIGDFLGFGDQLRLFTREAGFKSPESAGATGILAARGEGVSYAYGTPTGEITFPFSDSSGTFGILDYAFVVPSGGTASFERHFVVGDGSLSSVIDEVVRARGEAHGTVTGRVTDADGVGVAGAWVTVIAPDGDAENQALSNEEGHYEMTATAGDRTVIASAQGRLRSPETSVTVSDDNASEVDLVVGARARLEIRATTDGPRPTRGESAPVKVSLQAVSAEAPDPRLGEYDVSGQRRMEFMGGGHDGFDVKPGTYRVVLSRGPEYAIVVEEAMVIEGPVTLDAHLEAVLDTSGWVGCDFHQHTTGSLDSEQSLQERLRENMSAGLDCAAMTDHDNTTDPGPALAALEAESVFHGVTSSEISVNGVGHFNAYPLPWDPAAPYAHTGAQFWADRTIPELFTILREIEGERVIQINHPRSDAFKGYFAYLARNPSTGTSNFEMGTDFDAVEVNGSLGSAGQYTAEGWAGWADTPNSSVPVLADWFGMLNRGEPICAVGNSDTHDLGDDAGYPRTYLRVTDDSPATLTDEDIVGAIALQHAIVSRGFVVDLETNGSLQMGHSQVVNGSADVPVALHIKVHAAPWLGTDAAVELYRNGLHLETRQADAPESGTLVFEDTFALSPDQDSWYVFVIRGSGSGHPVFGGSPYAYTNPVYVDGDGDGAWTPPGPIVP
jgi:hypothetical protein